MVPLLPWFNLTDFFSPLLAAQFAFTQTEESAVTLEQAFSFFTIINS